MFLKLLYLFFVYGTLLLPGYVFVKKTKLLAKNPGAELAISYLATIVFFGLLASLAYIFHLSLMVTRVLSWLTIIVAAIEIIRAKYYKNLYSLRFPLLCLLAMALLATSFFSLTFHAPYDQQPDPVPLSSSHYDTLNVKVLNIAQTQANDNYVPYRQAQFFINRSDPGKDSFIGEWGVSFFERTPLMGAVTANYFNLFAEKPPIDLLWSKTSQDPHHTYLQFQLIAAVMNALFIVPAYYLLIKLFNKKSAVVTCLFLVVSQFFLYDNVFSWPKSLVAFFILLSWLLLLEKKRTYTILAAVSAGVAYLTHDLAILYIGTTIIYLLYKKRFFDSLICVLIPLGFALPWLYAASVYYKQTSTFLYYPISTGGLPQIANRIQIIHTFLHTSPLRLLKIRADNLVYLLTPFQLFSSEGGQTLFRRLWAGGLYNIPGALGPGLLIPAYIAGLKSWKNFGLMILILVPVILETLFIGWPKGLGALHFAEPIVVVLSGLAIAYLIKLERRWWLLLAYILNIIQLGFFISYSFKFKIAYWFSNWHDSVRILYIFLLVIIIGWLIDRIASGKKIWIV